LQDCVLPDCFCSFDGTQVPGGLEVSQVPQMITITFNGAVNVDNIEVYQDVFKASFVYFIIIKFPCPLNLFRCPHNELE
jgi:hypothetical protein